MIYGAHINRGVPLGFAYATGTKPVGDGLSTPEQTYLLDDCELRVVFKDDQSNAELAASAARELVEVEGADILIGSINPGVTAAMQRVARDNNVILIAAPSSASDLTGNAFDPNTFRASRHNYQDSMAVCDHFVNNEGFKTFVQIAPDYPFGHGNAAAYRDSCTFYGGEFVAEDVIAPASTIDFEPFLSPLADSEADAFLVTWTGGGYVNLDQAARDLGVVDDDTALGAVFVDNVVLPSLFKHGVGTTSLVPYHYTVPSNPANHYLIANQAAVGGDFPDLFDADGMNAAIMVVEALRRTGGAADVESLRASLEGLNFDGPRGPVEIRREDHTAIQDLYIVKLVNLDDPEKRFFEHVATVRPEPPCLLTGEYLARCGDLPVGRLNDG